MKVIKTPTLKFLVIFFDKNEGAPDFYTNPDGVTYHKISPANMRPSEKEKFSKAFIYSR